MTFAIEAGQLGGYAIWMILYLYGFFFNAVRLTDAELKLKLRVLAIKESVLTTSCLEKLK